MKIALCQINTVAGNVRYNLSRILHDLQAAAAAGAGAALFQELVIPGYPPRDLLDYPEFLKECDKALAEIGRECARLKIGALVGTVAANLFNGKKPLCNAAIWLPPDGGNPVTFYKKLLPTYDVFDEQRYFDSAPLDLVQPTINLSPTTGESLRLGVTICEDLWNDSEFWKSERLYPVDPVDSVVDAGANVIVNISSSPFTQGKPIRRLDMMRHIARRRRMPVIMVNQVGGNDQVVFDGGSTVVASDGTIQAAAGWFCEGIVYWDTVGVRSVSGLSDLLKPVENNTRSILSALKLGLKDYMARTGFSQVIVGNSGGIDSAVVLALAVHTLGAENVISVTMPSQFTSSDTLDDAGILAENLGIRHLRIPLGELHQKFSHLLADASSPVVSLLFEGDAGQMNSIAEENIQARIRADILMYISNAISSPRAMVVSTGNKSELAVGYCTLYGDMCGGLALLSDVPKMAVYKLAHMLNEIMNDPIPASIIQREPSAELAPGQKDQDSLPPYPVLDEIIRQFIEEHLSADDIIASGVASDAVVRRVVRLIENAEYKRAQAAPGIKVTSKAFGSGRRVPIARGTPVLPGGAEACQPE